MTEEISANRSQKSNRVFLRFSLLFALIFFFVAEWRWEAMLLAFPDVVKPYAAAAVASILVIFTGMFSWGKKRVSLWLILMLLAYFAVVVVLNIGDLTGAKNYALSIEFGTLCIWLALFLTANNEEFWQYIYDHPKRILAMFMLYVLPLFFILFYSGVAVQSNFNLRNVMWISELGFNSQYGVVYVHFGDKLAMISFVVLSLKISRIKKYLAGILAFVALYVCGGKASMVGYIFACCAYYVISLFFTKRYVKLCMISLLFCFALIAGFVVVVGNSSLQNSNNWIVRTVARGEKDSSLSSRRMLEENNKTTRVSRIILGNYKFDYKLGRPSTHTHNVLSVIDYYGLPIFIVSVGLWFYLLFRLTLLIKYKLTLVTAAMMSMLFYTLVFTIARSPHSMNLTFWTLGLAAFATSRRVNGATKT